MFCATALLWILNPDWSAVTGVSLTFVHPIRYIIVSVVTLLPDTCISDMQYNISQGNVRWKSVNAMKRQFTYVVNDISGNEIYLVKTNTKCNYAWIKCVIRGIWCAIVHSKMALSLLVPLPWILWAELTAWRYVFVSMWGLGINLSPELI